VMIAGGGGLHLPEWLSPLTTFLVVGAFFLKSRKARQ
jgi:hypothetical protein